MKSVSIKFDGSDLKMIGSSFTPGSKDQNYSMWGFESGVEGVILKKLLEGLGIKITGYKEIEWSKDFTECFYLTESISIKEYKKITGGNHE